jgi:hypothetical protein
MPEPRREGQSSEDHRFAGTHRNGALLEIWCACGWMSRAGPVDGFDFLNRHIMHSRGLARAA